MAAMAKGRSVVQGYFRGGAPRFSAALLQPKLPAAHVAAGLAARPAARIPAVAAVAAAGSARAVAQRVGNGEAFQLPPALSRFGGGGQALPAAVQRKMESYFGASFADVRVHVGPEAPAIGALAFTHGSHLYFAPGQYDPASVKGQQLLGHELAHVVQQRAGRVRNPFGGGVAVVQDPGLEAEADRLGMMAAAHSGPCAGGNCGIQRKTAGAVRDLRPSAAGAKSSAQPKIDPSRMARLAGHVRAAQAKIGGAGSAASHVSAAIARPAPATGARPGIQKKSSGYKLVIGAYMHGQEGGTAALPEDLAGHTFVAVESPKGREAWGFSPADRKYDPHGDLGQLRSGVAGRVHDDQRAFGKPGVRVKSYEISAQDARSAQAKVDEYRRQHYGFSLQQRQCATFALDVARAAHVNAFPGSRVVKPRDLYNHL